ncbi:hypothetical protein ASPWEDRAFT_36657 [Aspergillus wentii DTO 134E9]|uniref:Purine-cytosine permease n=1 Tax=Aspergillus wentii DTO 134E9 TaxID=1073089 RepID=A0A1L9RVP2_ASPWE|nr:uncharacterized protein ASPWEDRAFT_36657 [Aspergillus wentii DTO 134E9]OJJ38954.1 hypothetical protein ASPWEDRAFT_36657 [Aspergillus wentii DTO 134E9]
MATFGMRIFQLYERVAWLPQLLTFCVLIGSAASRFDFDAVSVGSPERVNAKHLSFFSLCLSIPVAWIPLSADYYVYYQPTTKRSLTWSMTSIGAYLGMAITVLMGVGLGTGVTHTSEWKAIYDGTPGSLLMAGYDSVGVLGKICAVINVLGVVACNAPGSYSMAMNFQMLGDYWLKIPRPFFTILTTVIYAACAIGGRDSLYEIFQNFLPLIGYWIIIWFTIVAEEDILFNRNKSYDWSIWNNWRKLPLGVAAGISFLVGWAGAIVGMDQVYYTGPIALTIAGGADLGLWLGAGFTALAFPPLRMLELWMVGR